MSAEPPATSPAAPPSAETSRAHRRRAVIGWSLYDLANTVFFLLVVTIYLPRQLAELTGRESALAWSYVPTMLVAALLSPAFGAAIDRSGHAKRLTFALTLVCCLATALLGFTASALVVSLLYAIARFAYEMASVPYNALLPQLAARGLGGISGLGVALGYLGNVLALAALLALGLEDVRWFEGDERKYVAVYLFAAGLFLCFTLPFQLWVREKPPESPQPLRWRDLTGATGATLRAVRRQLADPARRRYLIGMLLVCDALNTVLMQLARYAERQEGLGLGEEKVLAFLLSVQGAAIAGGIVVGRLADRTTARHATLLSVGLFALGLAAAQFLPGFWLRSVTMGLLGGVGLAGVWAAGRQWLLDLVPPNEVGEAFGFYGLVQRASVLTIYPFTKLFDVTASYAGSVLLLLVVLAAGFALLRRTPSRRAPPDAVPRPA